MRVRSFGDIGELEHGELVGHKAAPLRAGVNWMHRHPAISAGKSAYPAPTLNRPHR
jgi:hypothetical protein